VACRACGAVRAQVALRSGRRSSTTWKRSIGCAKSSARRGLVRDQASRSQGVRSFSVSVASRKRCASGAGGITCASLSTILRLHAACARALRVFAGGASRWDLPASLADIPLDFDTFNRTLLHRSRRDRALAALPRARRCTQCDALFADESCGQCTPCRVGTDKAVRLMRRFRAGNVPLLEDLSRRWPTRPFCDSVRRRESDRMRLKYFQQNCNHEYATRIEVTGETSRSVSTVSTSSPLRNRRSTASAEIAWGSALTSAPLLHARHASGRHCRACRSRSRGTRGSRPHAAALRARHGRSKCKRTRASFPEDGVWSFSPRTCRACLQDDSSSITGAMCRHRHARVFRTCAARARSVPHPAMAVNLDACINARAAYALAARSSVNDVIGYAFRGVQSKVVFDLDDPGAASTCVACGECVKHADGALHRRATRTFPVECTVDSNAYCGVGCHLIIHVKDNTIDARRRARRSANESALRQGPLRLRLRGASASTDEAADPKTGAPKNRRLLTLIRPNRGRCFAKATWTRRWRWQGAR